MVALVLVSHSRALALALRDTLAQLYGDRTPPIAVAAGTGENGGELGTDATAIVAAVEEVGAAADGVLVLLDLGSAVLSAELALDFLDQPMLGKVSLCSAPLVEGAIAAAAQCGIGAGLADVRAEAENALRQKIEHLGGAVSAAPEHAFARVPDAPPVVAELRVSNPHGLHARPAMRIVQAAAAFKSEVRIQNLRTGAPPASARSLVAINCLDARPGDTIRVTAAGADAAEAVRALVSLHAERFGDAPDGPADSADAAAIGEAAVPPVASGGRFPHGAPLSDGLAVGTLFFAEEQTPLLPPPSGFVQPAVEIVRLHGALANVRAQLEQSAATANARFGPENAAILQAHRMLADDPALTARAAALIEQDRLPATHAWQQACREIAASFRRLEQPRLRERARDFEDLSLRVLRELGAGPAPGRRLPDGPCIFVAPVLLPSDVSAFDPARVRGVIAGAVGQTSHAAILLRAAGIPAVENVDLERLRAAAGAGAVPAALDGGTGEVWLDPDETVRSELARRRQAAAVGTRSEGDGPPAPLHTRDGWRVDLAANVASAADAAAAARAGAEAIGLLRTEFLFFDRRQPPTEDEQTDAMRRIAAAMPPGSPVTVRTFDIGGDKPVPYLPVPPETNPFLGVRGLRLALLQPALFLTHLRAILRAAHGHRFRVMFPMVTEVAEVRRARALLAEAHGQLTLAGVDHAWPVETGMMVEVPAAALDAPLFLPEVDFFSVGTNDLTQYTLAAERGHPRLAPFADAAHPAVLRLVARVAAVAARAGKWVGVCGEAAADPVAAGIFIGLGVRELSVGAGSLGRVRRMVSACDQRQNRVLARRCLRAESGAEVRRRWER